VKLSLDSQRALRNARFRNVTPSPQMVQSDAVGGKTIAFVL